jgi:signal transduction histidine kinase
MTQDREASRKSQEFFANMSHAMRTPMNGVIGFAELIHDGKAGAVTEKQKEFLNDILKSSRHILRLINDVRDLLNIEAGTMTFRPETIDVAALIAEVSAMAGLSTGRYTTIESRISPLCSTVETDRPRLKQILANYLSNALKFTPENGHIVVRVQPEGEDEFRIEVEDSGVGISGRDQARLFATFQQLDTSSGRTDAGSGLGLALTKGIVEALGGSVGVSSTPGAGSTFFAVIPQTRAEAAPVSTRNSGEHHAG